MSDPLLGNRKLNIFQRMKQSVDEGLITCCLLFTIIGMILIIVALPISQIVVGSLYINQCPMDYLIPIHLIVSGVAMFILLISIIVQIFMEKVSFFSLVRIVLQMFCLGWFITGSIWTFRSRQIVQYNHPDTPNTYCHQSLFRCAFVTLFISYGLLAGTICYGKKR